MSQNEIIKILKKNPDKWVDSNILNQKLDVNKTSIANSLRVLRRTNFIIFKQSYNSKKILYKYKEEHKE